MNIFRYLGDSIHLIAILILVEHIVETKSCSGISGKSQILFALVFVTRYLDLFTHFISLYNTVMKIFYLASSFATVYLIYFKFKATYDKTHDTFRIEFLLIPSTILALIINHEFDVLEILWTFSIYLESVAILPQLFMISSSKEIKYVMKFYLAFLTSYRALYVFNWIYRYYDESFLDFISFVCGTIQVFVYLEFFLKINFFMKKTNDSLLKEPNELSNVTITTISYLLDSNEKPAILAYS
jgi:ER lumen protein retaining receptor